MERQKETHNGEYGKGKVEPYDGPPLCSRVIFTFVYIRGQTAYKHLAGEAFDAFTVLVGVTVGGAEDSWNTLVAVAVVEEIVVDGEEGGASCGGGGNGVQFSNMERTQMK